MITHHNFIAFYTYSISKDIYHLNNIPNKWKLIIMADGSFTQNLNSLTGKEVFISLINQKQLSIINDKREAEKFLFRQIWLEDKNQNKFAFAESLWKLSTNATADLTKKQPIGKSLIEFEIDFHKKIQNIKFGYSHFIGSGFKTQRAIWSREYTLLHNNQNISKIKEFFSPRLPQYFNYQKILD